MLYNKDFTITVIKHDDESFEIGDRVAFKHFFKKSTGKIIRRSKKRSNYYVVLISDSNNDVLHEFSADSMFLLPLTRFVLIEKSKF